jgi:NAD(P)-dependent dehydrogenase (short-subunit alcohol dehydrogenase family)
MAAGIVDIFRLEGRRALVTGASSGLGRHFALTLARAGADVIAAARRDDLLRDLVSEIAKLGGTAHAVSLDVRNAESVRRCFDEIAWSGGPADIIVNNAGVTITKRLLDHDEDDWDAVVDTNLKGSWLVAQDGARRLIEARSPGNIVNIASILGSRVAGGVAVYAIAKAGLLHMTKALALELARYDIRVNAILPGYIETDLNRDFLASEAGARLKSRIPTQRFGTAADLDGPLLLLASAAGAYMTGALLAVDGGHLVSSL